MQIIFLDIDGVLVTRKSLKNGQSGVIEKFVIVDDDSDMGHLNKHLVRTEMEDGLTTAHADEIIQRLSACPA